MLILQRIQIHLSSFASKDGVQKTEFFAYIISRKRSTNQLNQLRKDVFHVQTSLLSLPKISARSWKNKNRP